ILSGARPRLVDTQFLAEAGVATVPTQVAAAAALRGETRPSALWLTAPIYYGWLPDLPDMARVAAALGVPLWVDEAHGALHGFHPDLPPGAQAAGASAAVRRSHKGGGSLVQSSFLLLVVAGPDSGRVDAALALLKSTSPSLM